MIALALAATLGAASGAPSDAAVASAEVLFAAAREARSQSGYAHYAVYATVLHFRRGERHLTSTWDTIEDMRRRLVHAHSLSREENAHPHVPRGFDVVGSVTIAPMVFAAPGAIAAGPALSFSKTFTHEWQADPVGELTLAVDQDFGLALNAPPIGATADMSEVAATAPTLPRIGRTGTIARTYEVTDLGDVDEDGARLHHLALRPLRDPRRYRLRELWLDAATSLPVRAVVAGIGNRGPLDRVSWRVDFKQFQGGTYVMRETALAPLETRDGRLDDVSITFDDVRPANRLSAGESLGLSGEVGTTDP